MNKQEFQALRNTLKENDKVTVQLRTFQFPLNLTVFGFSELSDELLFKECVYAIREDIISCNKKEKRRTNNET